MFHLLADLVVVVHLGFVLFVLLGGVAVWRWPRLAWIHLPAVVWGVLVEMLGWVCPLTPLENWLRFQGGGTPYAGGFVEQYLEPVLYPPSLTRARQVVLGAVVVAVNAAVYGVAWRRARRRRRARRDG